MSDEAMPQHDGWGMTEEQLDGLHCTYCDRAGGAMEPVYLGPRGQMFRHPECSQELEAVDKREPRSELGRVAQGLGLPLREVPSPPGTAPWER